MLERLYFHYVSSISTQIPPPKHVARRQDIDNTAIITLWDLDWCEPYYIYLFILFEFD